MRTQCRFCGERVDTDANGVYQYVKGWVRLRKGGGLNAIRLPERMQMWACHACIEELSTGKVDQPTLF